MDKKGIARRIVAGFGANIFGQAIVAGVQLAGVPIYLHFWGLQMYGEWLILFSIPSYLAIATLAFGQSAANDMTQLASGGDRKKALGVMQSLFALTSFLVVIGGAIVTLLLITLPASVFHAFLDISPHRLRWTLWFLAAEVLIRFFDGVNHAGFRANGEYGLHTFAYYVIFLGQNASAWLLVICGASPLGAAMSFFFIRLLTVPIVALWLTRRHYWIEFGFKWAQFDELRRLAQPALANFCVPLAQVLNIQGMVLVVGATLGPVAVVVYSTLRTLTRLAFQLVVSVSQATEPELAAAFGSADHALLRRLYHGAARSGLWLAIVAGLVLHALGAWILSTWTHGQVQMNAALFDWLLLSALSGIVWYSSLTVLKAANIHIRVSVIYCGAVMLSVLVAYFLLRNSGSLYLGGVALLASDFVAMYFMIRDANKLCEEGFLTYARAVLNPVPLFDLLHARHRWA